MNKKQKSILAGIVIIIAVLFLIHFLSQNNGGSAKKTNKKDMDKKELSIKNKTTISIDRPDDKELMDKRKSEYGVDKGLDMVIKSDEKVSIYDKTIDMEKIEEDSKILRGELISSDLSGKKDGGLQNYGLYIVKEKDNLWDIHFRLLKELFNNKGIKLSSKADEPDKKGYSSGVGKILKFSEAMVSIYSLDTGAISFDINNIEPSGKVVIYKMNEIESLLKDITLKEIENVVFDGRNIWIESN